MEIQLSLPSDKHGAQAYPGPQRASPRSYTMDVSMYPPPQLPPPPQSLRCFLVRHVASLFLSLSRRRLDALWLHALRTFSPTRTSDPRLVTTRAPLLFCLGGSWTRRGPRAATPTCPFLEEAGPESGISSPRTRSKWCRTGWVVSRSRVCRPSLLCGLVFLFCPLRDLTKCLV